MNRTSKLAVFVILFILLSTYLPNNKTDKKSLLFQIKKIEIENNNITSVRDLMLDLNSLKGKNLLFLNHKTIEQIISKFDFILSFRVKKIFPNTLKIIVLEKKLVALHVKGKNKFYISKNGDLIEYLYIKRFENLPLVIGNQKNFIKLYDKLKIVQFPLKEVKSYNYQDIDRWDLVLKSGKLIKLPKNNYIESLKNFLRIKDNKNFENYQIFDYRIKDQLILN